MRDKFDKISDFINEHHVLSLATSYNDNVSACSLFYTFIKEHLLFVVASNDDTLHISNVKKNNKVAGNIFLETTQVDKIQGVQFKGDFYGSHDEKINDAYFNKFPYAKSHNAKLWIIKVDSFKMTDNTIGFGEKIIWP